MVLPLSLLKTAENHPMLLELKNGDTYNGRLVSVNMFMNICLKDVICTSRDGDRFWKLPEVYIRGNSIKYLRIPDEVIEMVSEEESKRKSMNAGGRNMGRGGRLGSYGRGRGDGEGRGGRDGGRGEGRGGRDGGRGKLIIIIFYYHYHYYY